MASWVEEISAKAAELIRWHADEIAEALIAHSPTCHETWTMEVLIAANGYTASSFMEEWAAGKFNQDGGCGYVA